LLDIIIIGAGPVGSRTAFQLAKMGHYVAVLEKRQDIGEKLCCTGIVSQECITHYFIPPEIIYHQANSASIFSPSGDSIRVYRPESQACIVDRQAFDRFWSRCAQSQGVEYHLHCKANRILPKPDKVVIEVERDGYPYQLEARAVVLACGFNSSLVRNLGLGQTGSFTTGAQTEVVANGIKEVEVYFGQKIAPGFFAWLVPTSNGKALVGLMTHRSPGIFLKDLLIELEAQGKIAVDNAQVRFGGIPLRPVARTYDDRLLVVGDAAGQVKPTTGGGIYFGLLCADIAADTLHGAFQAGDLSARKLSRYEKSWRQKIGHELRIEYFARQFYESLNDKQIDKLFSSLKSSGIVDSLLRDNNLSFDWHGGLMMKVLRLGVTSQVSRLLRL
jgi:digeranylgeranylglycerophospholipid reductase